MEAVQFLSNSPTLAKEIGVQYVIQITSFAGSNPSLNLDRWNFTDQFHGRFLASILPSRTTKQSGKERVLYGEKILAVILYNFVKKIA